MTNAKNAPTVSVIIATYNRARLIGEAIQSVLNQTFRDFELIIIDDASTDKTEEIVNGSDDKRLKYIRFKKNTGGCLAPRNTGLEAARGEYIACLDDDDVWLDGDKLKKQVEFLDSHPDHVLVDTNTIVVDENNTELYRSFLPEKDNEIRDILLERNCFVHSGAVYRKSAAMIVGGYSPAKGTTGCDDHGLWLKLGTVGKFANLPIYGVKRTSTLRRDSAKNRIMERVNTIQLISKYRNKYPNYWRAIRIRYAQLADCCLRMISSVPPFSNLKRFLKRKCPACWRVVTRVQRNLTRSY